MYFYHQLESKWSQPGREGLKFIAMEYKQSVGAARNNKDLKSLFLIALCTGDDHFTSNISEQSWKNTCTSSHAA